MGMKFRMSLSVFFLYFSILLVSIYFIPFEDVRLNYDLTNLQVQQYYQGRDMASFASGGQAILDHGWFTDHATWLINLWPPGFMLLQGVILKIFGLNAPFIFILTIINCILWGVVFALMFAGLRERLPFLISLILPCLFLASSLFRNFILKDGILLGETFSVAFSFLGIALILKKISDKYIQFIGAGACFALSAYFRSQYEVFFTISTAIILPLLLIQVVKDCLSRKGLSLKHEQYFIFKGLIVTVISFHFFTMPFRIYNYTRMGSMSWVQSLELTWNNSWAYDDDLNKLNGIFIVRGGGTTACHIQHDLCEQFHNQRVTGKNIDVKILRNATIRTFLEHPFLWMKIKFSKLTSYWFESDFRNTENLLYLILILFSVGMIMLIHNKHEQTVWVWSGLSFLLAHVLIFVFVHFEERYLFFFKLYALFSSIMLLSSTFKIKADLSRELRYRQRKTRYQI